MLKVSATARLAHWIVRLEDVDLDGQVWLITGAALNGAQRQTPPDYLQPNQIYILTFQLHFTTWTFLLGHRIRIAVSNGMFPAFWPSPYSMNTSLYLNSSATFIDLPIIPSTTPPPQPPPFTQQQVSIDDQLPELFSGGRSKDYEIYTTDLNTTISYEQITYELLPNNCFIAALIQWNHTCSYANPSHVEWKAIGQQVYVFDMDRYQSIDDIPIDGLYPNVDLSLRRHFELYTELVVRSDEEYFYTHLKRLFSNSNGTKDDQPVEFIFDNKHKRQFQ